MREGVSGHRRSASREVGGPPLALEQAVNFQLATGTSCEDYLDLFDQRVRELLSEGQPAAYPTTVAAFLAMAFASRREADPAAAELLELFAYLGPSRCRPDCFVAAGPLVSPRC